MPIPVFDPVTTDLASITGTVKLPGRVAPLEGTWYAEIRTMNGATIDSDGTVRAGAEVAYDDGSGATMDLPPGSYRFRFQSSSFGLDGQPVNLGWYAYDLTADTLWGDIMETPVEVPVTPSDVTRAEEAREAAETAAAAAQAVGTTNDTVIAGRLNDATSATRAAADTQYVREGSAFADIAKQPGVDPTGTTECAAAINTALNAIAGFGGRAYGRGTFKIASTVTIANNADLGDAVFRYTPGTGTAVRLGTATSGAYVENKRIIAPKVIATAKTATGWAQVAGTIGIDASNLYSCTLVEIPAIQGFETGLRAYGKGKGNVHNTYVLGHLYNNKVQFLASADGTGWSNQNIYIGGRFQHDSGEGANIAGVRHIAMDVLANAVNNNIWLNPSVEGDTPEYHALIAGVNNYIVGGRWEVSGGARVRWASDAVQNRIDGGYHADQIIESFAVGAAGSNRIESGISVWLAQSAGTRGVQILENSTSSSQPSDIVMEAGARVAQANPATAWAVYRSASDTRMKRAADAFSRIILDHINGRMHLGTGAAAPTAYLAQFATPDIWQLNGASLAFNADDTYDLGIASFRPRYVRASRGVQPGAFATGSRPSASAAGVGAMIYDTTLSKPIWSDGTQWRDATGTAV